MPREYIWRESEARQILDGRGSSPVFSVITATLNSADVLPRTIASLEKQTFARFEWIIVDGGSKDGTVEHIRKASSLVHNWTSEPDQGIADAWNKGLQRAGGDYVLVLNAGDTYDPHALEVFAKHLTVDGIACSHARLLTEAGAPAGTLWAEPYKLHRGMHVPHNWCAVPRRYYTELGGYKNLPLAMDFDWFHRYFRRFGVKGFLVIDQVLGSYYLGGASDRHFWESFSYTQRILVENGCSPAVATGYRLAYAAKHLAARLTHGNGSRGRR